MSLIKDFFQVKDSLRWNDITENIRLITMDEMKLETRPSTKIDIDGEIMFDTPVDIKLLKDKVKLLYIDVNE